MLVHRIILSCLGIRQSLRLKDLNGGEGTLGFFTPLLFERCKLRYLKGPYGRVNSRSALERCITRHFLHSALPRPMEGDWESARLWRK